MNPSRPKIDSFCSPQPHWHHLENTVLRIDGAVANMSAEDLDNSIRRAEVLDNVSSNDEIKEAVRTRFGLDTIEEETEDSPDTAKEVAFETTVGERPVSARLKIIDAEGIDAVEITTTPQCQSEERPSVTEVIEMDKKDGKIHIYRKMAPADNWMYLDEDEKKEILNWRGFETFYVGRIKNVRNFKC